MKKILLTSSALVLLGGAAYAEVILDGSAALGVIGGDDFETGGDDVDDIEYSFVSDFDIGFTLAGETDTGLVFGASIELDDAIDSPEFADEEDQGGESVFVSGEFGRISFGDTNGAFDASIDEYIGAQPGTIGDMEEVGAYNGVGLDFGGLVTDLSDGAQDAIGGLGSLDPLDDGLDGFYDGQIARYDYTFGSFTVSASAELDDDNEGDPVLGIGAVYDLEFGGGVATLGAAYQYVSFDEFGIVEDADGDEVQFELDGDIAVYGASVEVSTDIGVSFNAAVVQTDLDIDADAPGVDANLDEDFISYGIGLGYSFDAISVGASYGLLDLDEQQVEGYSFTAEYDLGGGLALQAGVGVSDIEDRGEDLDDEEIQYSFGLNMSF